MRIFAPAHSIYELRQHILYRKRSSGSRLLSLVVANTKRDNPSTKYINLK